MAKVRRRPWLPFSRLLQRHSEQLGYSVQDVATLLGVALTTFRKWWEGLTFPATEHHQILVATFLGWTLEELWRYRGHAQSSEEEMEDAYERDQQAAFLREARREGKARKKKLKEV